MEMSLKTKTTDTVIRVPPFYYLHVLDQITNVTRLLVGPQTYIRQDNERVLVGPERMITIPPRHYCLVENPVVRNAEGTVEFDKDGQVKLMFADIDVRLAQEPFPLWPGELLKKSATKLKVVLANTALLLKSALDFTDESGEKRIAGDEWLFVGPGTYIPRKEVEEVRVVEAVIIFSNQAIRLKARKENIDKEGVLRVTGEEWLVKKTGAYLQDAYEEVVKIVEAYVLNDKRALHVAALQTFTDDFGKLRKNGEEWLIKASDTETHIPNVNEKVQGLVNITTLTNRQYCVILDPVDSKGVPQLGRVKQVKGEKSFFLQPGETLQKGIQNVYVLGEDEGLILRAIEGFHDDTFQEVGKFRKPGDRWMVRGPVEIIPPVEVEVVTKRSAIPLDENEGIYVRNVKNGKVRAIIGETYMLNQDEELFEKILPSTVENLLCTERDPLADRGERRTEVVKAREKHKVITFRVPHNAAVQIYDYKEKQARVLFGPDLVMLGPDEQFTQLSLSGGKPKTQNQIRTICLLLGPDFMTDVIVVETADHARLKLQLSYNWYFDLKTKTEVDAANLFSVPDFVGDACKAIASRIRGSVAGVQFDNFHKNSSKIIRASTFGTNEAGKIRDKFIFPQNGLTLTSIDIQSVEPVDQRTRDALQKSVQLAIEITTNSQEAAARHAAERLEQEARGELERQKIHDEAEAEKARKELLELQASSAAVESTGQAKAEAQSRAWTAKIEAESAVEQADLKNQATDIEWKGEKNRLEEARSSELHFSREKNSIEITKTKEMADIETSKFKLMVDAIGPQTLLAMSTAGPDLQVKLLQALGLKSTLITDGNTPINLFSAANGFVSGGILPAPQKKRKTHEEELTDED